jgi:hypothetical protein
LVKRNDFQGETEKVAYDLYVQRGMVNGYDLDDWFQAEKIVMAQHAPARRSKIETIMTPPTKGRIQKKEKTA